MKDEGPYFVDERLLRSDIRSDPSDGALQEGVPLMLAIKVVRAEGPCEPVEGVHVDIWHCNAHGIYSDVAGNQTVGRKFLRGCQRTSASGEAHFTTIFPGWYSGRTVYIHFKVRLLHDKERYGFPSQCSSNQTLSRSSSLLTPPTATGANRKSPMWKMTSMALMAGSS